MFLTFFSFRSPGHLKVKWPFVVMFLPNQPSKGSYGATPPENRTTIIGKFPPRKFAIVSPVDKGLRLLGGVVPVRWCWFTTLETWMIWNKIPHIWAWPGRNATSHLPSFFREKVVESMIRKWKIPINYIMYQGTAKKWSLQILFLRILHHFASYCCRYLGSKNALFW